MKKKINLSELTFEGKHKDEIILHYCKPSNKQTYYEVFKILLPMTILGIIFTSMLVNEILPMFVIVLFFLIFTV
jgi:hypothetical protein